MLHWADKGFPELGDSSGNVFSSLIVSGNGMGNSTYSVITSPLYKTDAYQAAREVWENGGKSNAPNGAVMRTSVTSIPHFHDLDKVIANTKAFAKTTHADPRYELSSSYTEFWDFVPKFSVRT